jgi:hypothetical protein
MGASCLLEASICLVSIKIHNSYLFTSTEGVSTPRWIGGTAAIVNSALLVTSRPSDLHRFRFKHSFSDRTKGTCPEFAKSKKAELTPYFFIWNVTRFWSSPLNDRLNPPAHYSRSWLCTASVASPGSQSKIRERATFANFL